MPIQSMVTRCCFMALSVCWLAPNNAQAGPLLEWLFGGFGRRQPPAYPVGPPSAVGGPQNVGAYYGASMPIIGDYGYGYVAQSPVGISAATLPQPTVSYLPDYRTNYLRAPVTYYRPVLTTDPRTGSQVVTLAPCTSYEYQAQRVPTLGTQALFNTYGLNPAWTRPAAPAVQTYTLPSGGIPLAAANPNLGYSTGYGVYPPAYSPYSTLYAPSSAALAPYSTGYGNYSALQPPQGAIGLAPAAPGPNVVAPPPQTNYPTSPYIPGGYYGTSSGGCTGSYPGPLSAPGLVAPVPSGPAAAPSGIYPPLDQPALNPIPQGAIIPQGTMPAQPSSPPPSAIGPFPSQAVPSGTFRNPADANAQPMLGPTGQSGARLDPRPSLQNVLRQPASLSDHPLENSSRGESRSTNAPLMMPIPVPKDFDPEPRWNPGLLNESDQTAQNSHPGNAASHAMLWGAKPIQWASFSTPIASDENEQSRRMSNQPSSTIRSIDRDLVREPASLPANEDMRSPVELPRQTQMVPLPESSRSQLRPVLELGAPASDRSMESAQRPAATAPPTSGSTRYRTNGWKAAR